MKLKAQLIFIGIIGISIISCQSKKSTKLKKSEFLTDSIFSKSLSEYRTHSVYLPKGFSQEKKYPIIYATDGNSNVTDKKELFDSLIDNNIIVPVIFVASFSNNKIADSTSTTLGNGEKVYLNYRNFEYTDRKPFRFEDSLLKGRFKNHRSYFAEELIGHIEEKYGQDNDKENRYFYGVSNGAGFGMTLLNNQPDLIGTYLCFSTFGGDIQDNTWNKDKIYPNLYFKYGSEEPFFIKDNAEFLKQKYAESNSFIEIEEFEGGHDNTLWNREFIETMSKILK